MRWRNVLCRRLPDVLTHRVCGLSTSLPCMVVCRRSNIEIRFVYKYVHFPFKNGSLVSPINWRGASPLVQEQYWFRRRAVSRASTRVALCRTCSRVRTPPTTHEIYSKKNGLLLRVLRTTTAVLSILHVESQHVRSEKNYWYNSTYRQHSSLVSDTYDYYY